jgi:hypothetical protein
MRAFLIAIINAIRAALGLALLPIDWLLGARPPETADLAVARHVVAGAEDDTRRVEEMEAQLAAAEAHEIEEERLAAARKASTPGRRPAAKIAAFPEPEAADEDDQEAAPAPRI